MHKLHKTAKKPKVLQFIDSFFEKFGTLSQEEIKETLTQIILTVVKQATKEDIKEFFEQQIMEKGKASGTKILRIFKDKLDVIVDISSYLSVGMAVISQYVDYIKSLAQALINEYGKTKKDTLTYEELNTIVNKKIKDPNENWKVIAILE